MTPQFQGSASDGAKACNKKPDHSVIGDGGPKDFVIKIPDFWKKLRLFQYRILNLKSSNNLSPLSTGKTISRILFLDNFSRKKQCKTLKLKLNVSTWAFLRGLKILSLFPHKCHNFWLEAYALIFFLNFFTRTCLKIRALVFGWKF